MFSIEQEARSDVGMGKKVGLGAGKRANLPPRPTRGRSSHSLMLIWIAQRTRIARHFGFWSLRGGGLIVEVRATHYQARCQVGGEGGGISGHPQKTGLLFQSNVLLLTTWPTVHIRIVLLITRNRHQKHVFHGEERSKQGITIGAFSIFEIFPNFVKNLLSPFLSPLYLQCASPCLPH